MTPESRGRDLFIVDNSVSGWTGLRYLEEWAGIAKSFDIATGYFEIGALLALDGKWQALDKIRILMGAEMTYRTRKALFDAVREKAVQILDGSIERAKDANPFLHGVPAILEAMRSGQIESRVYDKDKFHAKAYITHAKLEVIGSQALVGSSNFTSPGLTENIELNIQVQSAREVAQLQEWFEIHWNDASEVTDAVITTVHAPGQPCQRPPEWGPVLCVRGGPVGVADADTGRDPRDRRRAALPRPGDSGVHSPAAELPVRPGGGWTLRGTTRSGSAAGGQRCREAAPQSSMNGYGGWWPPRVDTPAGPAGCGPSASWSSAGAARSRRLRHLRRPPPSGPSRDRLGGAKQTPIPTANDHVLIP